jgi:hypothetical protein
LVFVVLNPIIFPTVHALIDFWAHPTDDFLTDIELELQKHANHPNVFVVTHFPVEFWLDSETHRQSDRFQSILANSTAQLLISGHLHPGRAIFRHFGGFLEVVASDSTRHGALGVVTIDNGCTVFHHIKGNRPPKAFVINPVPLAQIHKKTVFNERIVTIRVLLLAPIATATITVTGDATGRLKFERLVGNMALYSIRREFEPGVHHIAFEGVFTDKLEFLVGSETPERIEKSYYMPNFFNTLRRGTLVLWPILLVLLFPFELPCSRELAESVHLWLAGEDVESHWLLATLGGGLIVRWRILTFPIWFRLLLFGSCLYPMFFPIVFFQVEGHWGYLNAQGYFLDEQRFDVMGMIVPGLYLSFVVLPVAVLASSLAVARPWHDIVFFDITVAAGGFGMAFLITNVLLVQVSGIILANLTSIFSWHPLLLYGVLLKWRAKHTMDIYLNLHDPGARRQSV